MLWGINLTSGIVDPKSIVCDQPFLQPVSLLYIGETGAAHLLAH